MITLSRPILMLVTEASPRLEEIVAEAMAGGVDLVQWRDRIPPHPLPKGGRVPVKASVLYLDHAPSECSLSPRRTALPFGEDARRGPNEQTSPSYVRLLPLHIVNARSFDHLPAGAGGVHLPEHSISIAEARRQYGANILIGRSIHNIDSALQAEINGANYIVAGTIFASNSHPGETPAGLDFLREVCASVTIPVIAIGGITPQNTPDCLAAGAAGVAVLSPIMRAKDPKRVAEMYCEAMRYSTRISS